MRMKYLGFAQNSKIYILPSSIYFKCFTLNNQDEDTGELVTGEDVEQENNTIPFKRGLHIVKSSHLYWDQCREVENNK